MGLDRGSKGHTWEQWPLLEEIKALAQGRICRPPVKEKCRLENGRFAAWACRECAEFVRPEAISPWTWHFLLLYRLQKAGYPFQANDLSLETWLLLGLVKQILEGAIATEPRAHP